MNDKKAYTITILYTDGDADGIREISKPNWSGMGIVIPRTLMGKAKGKSELNRIGVYVLVGPPEASGMPRVYVGQGDPIKQRLIQHNTKKDFWEICIAFTSSDNTLNKAHVQYIESQLIASAAQAKRCILENSNTPAHRLLSPAVTAAAEGFLSEILLCFPVLGLNAFTLAASIQKNAEVLVISTKGIKAEGIKTPDGFVVYAGSGAVKKEVPSCPSHLKKIRADLFSKGVLKVSSDGVKFTEDYTFRTLSAAAGVVNGGSLSGHTAWKTKDSKTLKN